MPVAKGQQHLRKKVEVDLTELQEIVNDLEMRRVYSGRTLLFMDVADEYVRRHPDMKGLVTYTVVRLRFDKMRTPGTTLTCRTGNGRGKR